MSINNFDFMDWIEYPDDEELLNGPIVNHVYAYVSTRYLNGFINYMDIIVGAYMTRTHRDLANNRGSSISWECSCSLIDVANRQCADGTDVSDWTKYDDIHILARRGDFYYYFWKDCYGDESCIGKFSTSRFNSDEDAMAAMKEEIFQYDIWDMDEAYVRQHESDYIKYIPSSFFRGWITL